jgi:hypothetical protein
MVLSGSAHSPNAYMISAIATPTITALQQTIGQNPIGLSSIVRVQPRLVAVPVMIFFRMPHIAARPRNPNIMAWNAGDMSGFRQRWAGSDKAELIKLC